MRKLTINFKPTIMKKYTLIFAAILLISTNICHAVPLLINNNSDNNTFPGMYRVHTYLGFLEDGNTCNEDWVLPFIFDPGSSLSIDDGSFVFQSPFNNFHDCLSNFLGYNNCEPIDLDWDGQRFSLESMLDSQNDSIPNNAYPAGLIGLSTGGVECNPSSFLGNYNYLSYSETANSYSLLAAIPNNTSVVICKITYNRYGNLLATLSYE